MSDTNSVPSNPKHQLAVSALGAIFALNCLAAVNTIAQTKLAPPLEVFPAIFAGIGLAAFFLPLLRWRNPVGYAGAIVVAILSLTWPLLVLGGVVGRLSATVTLSPVGILTYMAMPVVLIVSTVLAWREAGDAVVGTASRNPAPHPAGVGA
jgi:hypothetical protein